MRTSKANTTGKTALILFAVFSFTQRNSAQANPADYDWSSCSHLQGSYRCVDEQRFSIVVPMTIFEESSSLQMRVDIPYNDIDGKPYSRPYFIDGRMRSLDKRDYYQASCQDGVIGFTRISLGHALTHFKSFYIQGTSDNNFLMKERSFVTFTHSDGTIKDEDIYEQKRICHRL